MIHDFFWEGARGDGGMHNVNWGTTQRPHALGALVLVILSFVIPPFFQMDLAVSYRE